jgi:hypothetical protein
MSDSNEKKQTDDNVNKTDKNINPALSVKSQQIPVKCEFSQKHSNKENTDN